MDLFDQVMALNTDGSAVRTSGPRAGWKEVVTGPNQTWWVNPTTRQVEKNIITIEDGGLDGMGGVTREIPWGALPSKDSFLDKYSLALIAAAFGGGALAAGGGSGAAAGSAAVGDAAIAGGAGTDALAGGAALGGGSGITPGVTAGGIGGGATGTGLAIPGTGAGLGASGISGAAASGSLAPGFFAAETLAPVLGGATAAAGMGATTAGAAASGGAGSLLSNPSILGAGLGAVSSLLGGGSKPAGTTTTVQDIPEWLKPYAAQGLGGLVDAYNTTPNGVAPVTAAGNEYLQDVIGGDYLNSNPYIDAMFNRAAGQVSAGVNSQFSKAGRYGSGAHTGVLSESLGNLATDIYGKNYATERQNQQQAAALSPSFGNSIINQPFLKGQNLLQGVNSIKGGTTSTPYFQNQLGDLLGGALGGAALGKLFGAF